MEGSGEGESMLDGLDPAGDGMDGEPDDEVDNHAAGLDDQADHAGHNGEPVDDELAKKKAKDKKIMMAGGAWLCSWQSRLQHSSSWPRPSPPCPISHRKCNRRR
ncbi:hypothetical protein CBP35_19805 (plasmid) [Acidovorax carolinensis]|nr:hypothetical protein CBP35_19805 [Acidovorax carolinensis]